MLPRLRFIINKYPSQQITRHIPCFRNISSAGPTRSFATQRKSPKKSFKGDEPLGTENTSPSKTPASFRWKVFAVGTTFISFYYVFRPFDEKKELISLPLLGPRSFTRCIVTSVTPDPPELGTRADHVIVQTTIPAKLLPKDGSHSTNAIHHIYIKDDDMQIERPYTPITGLGLDGKMTFWVKKYPKGEVSNWIARLMRGRNIEVRGPVQQWDWRANSYDEIIMISGGTGITAFTQLLHQALFPSQPVVSPVGSQTHFTLLHGHRSPSQMPPPIITDDFDLYRESVPDRFMEKAFVETVDHEADDPPNRVSLGLIDKGVLEKVLTERGILIDSKSPSTSISERLRGKITKATKTLNPDKSVMILVCGPEGMLTTFTGPQRPPGSQLHIGGVLGELGFQPSQVQRFGS